MLLREGYQLPKAKRRKDIRLHIKHQVGCVLHGAMTQIIRQFKVFYTKFAGAGSILTDNCE